MLQLISSFISQSIRVMNIANRVIPLMKNIYPKVNLFKNNIAKLANIPLTLSKNLNTSKNSNKKDINTPTFFQ